MENAWVLFQDLLWSSDWVGEEVGYPEYDVVGLYMLNGSDYGFYIDMESMRILDVINFGSNIMRQSLEAVDENMEFADGYETALIGVATRADGLKTALYNTEKILRILMDGGKTREEAQAYFESDIAGEFEVEDNAPLFVNPVKQA